MRSLPLLHETDLATSAGAATGGAPAATPQAGAHRGRRAVTATAMLASAALLAGCDIPSFIDPTEFTTGGNYKPGPAIQKPILDSLSALDKNIDDPSDAFYNATEVRPEDLQVISSDYQIGPGDLLSVSITDLMGQGDQSVKQVRVSESGNISLPLIGEVKATGLTEAQLQHAISDAYRNAQIVQNANVSVTVVEPQARAFSILGAVNAPGKYLIVQSDTRVLDALVLAHDVLQNVDTLYVIRQLDQEPENVQQNQAANPSAAPSTTESGQGAAPAPSGNPAAGNPPAGGSPTGNTPPAPGAEPGPAPTSAPVPGGPGDTLAPHSQATPAEHPNNLMVMQVGAGAAAVGGEYSNGTAAPQVTGGSAGTAAVTSGGGAHSFEFKPPLPPSPTRTIRIPLDALRNGDLRYNIVIRPHDMIIAPQPVVGEYYMGGHVARTGVYTILPGRKITLKQAIIAAGMLDGLAIPQRTDLIRRTGSDREVYVRVDLDKVFSGDQPDIYLKPADQVMVGTNLLATFIAAARGGFRITYGFGFLYDRNYAPAQTQTTR